MNDNIKNIIFDLGGVLVGLDPKRCIEAFRKVGCGVLANYVEEHRTEDLFLDTELGRISQEEFCNEVRRLSLTDTEDKDIVWAWNQLLTDIPVSKLRLLQRLRAEGYRVSCTGRIVATISSPLTDIVPTTILSTYSSLMRCTLPSPTPLFSVRLLPRQASVPMRLFSSTTERRTARQPRLWV